MPLCSRRIFGSMNLSAWLAICLWLPFFLPFIAAAANATERTERLVFAHYMACCPSAGHNASTEALRHEMGLAAQAGIDGFAINVGAWLKEPYYQEISSRLFRAARSTEFRLFFSADAATGLSSAEVIEMVARYSGEPAYLTRFGRPVLSTYGGTINWYIEIVEGLKARGIAIFFVPNARRPVSSTNMPGTLIETPDRATIDAILTDLPFIDGLFYFGAAGKYRTIAQSIRAGAELAHSRSKLYMAPVTPYYRGLKNNYRAFETDGFEGMAAEWIAAIEAGCEWVEIVTWNDWSESSYVQPFGGPPTLPLWNNHWGLLSAHDAYLNLSRYYIRWFKDGHAPRLEANRLHIFYRPQSSIQCISAIISNCPRGYRELRDDLHIVAETKEPITIEVTIGSTHERFNSNGGLTFFKMNLSPGPIYIVARSPNGKTRWQAPISYGSNESEATAFNYLSASIELKDGIVSLEQSRP